MKKKGIYIFIILTLSSILLISNAAIHPTGQGGYTGAPGDGFCANCHSVAGNIEGEINLLGIPDTIEPSKKYRLRFLAKSKNNLAKRAGFQMVVLDNDLVSVGLLSDASESSVLKTSIGKRYWGHAPAKNFTGVDSLSWEVDWTSPSNVNTVNFYLSSILANGNGSNAGDTYLTKKIELPVKITTSVFDEKQDDVYIYPNPARNTIQIKTEHYQGLHLSIFDLNGTPVLNYKMNEDERSLDISHLCQGFYNIKISTNKGIYIRTIYKSN
jgi:hypothetical protein